MLVAEEWPKELYKTGPPEFLYKHIDEKTVNPYPNIQTWWQSAS